MKEKLKIVFFAAYFLAAPLAGYYWNNHVWEERLQAEGGRIIQEQFNMMSEWGTGGTLPVPSGMYYISHLYSSNIILKGAGRDNTTLRWK